MLANVPRMRGRPRCIEEVGGHPTDVTMIPHCPESGHASTRPPNCGCPAPRQAECWDCCMPGVIETKILRRPQECIQRPCNYGIPAIPCWDPPKCPREPCSALCFDWTVDEPGPNDSYGLKGLNWYDWQMNGQYKEPKAYNTNGYKPAHPGFSINPPDPLFPNYVASCPMECYSRDPAPCKPSPFQTDVNYFRDWRCCEAKPPAPWKPPYKQWATRVDLCY